MIYNFAMLLFCSYCVCLDLAYIKQIFSYVHLSSHEEGHSDTEYSSVYNDHSEDHHHYIELYH